MVHPLFSLDKIVSIGPDLLPVFEENPVNPTEAGRVLILRSLLRYNDVPCISRQLAARWLINLIPLKRGER